MLFRPARKVDTFLHKQDGAMVIIGLFLFVGMLFTASLALDMARYEQERARVQGVADRAVLAAANIRRNGDGAVTSEEFLRGYFLAEGFTPEELDQWSIVAGDGITGRSVTILPKASMSTMLMSLIGVDELPLAAPARAEVGASLQMEVVLVLDISGSMAARTSNGLSRLENMKAAAQTMVSDLMEDREPGDVAITIAPYEAWVLPPPNLVETVETQGANLAPANGNDPCAGLSGAAFGQCRAGLGGANGQINRNGNNGNGNGNGNNNGAPPPAANSTQLCADFTDWNAISDFRGNGNSAYARGRSQSWQNAVRRSMYADVQRVNCGPAYGFRVMRPMMTDEAAINSHIQSLSTMGTTSIDLGVRYGAMMFDTSLRPFIEAEVDAGRLPETMRGRPSGLDDDSVLRVMVLMTDGQNCCGARGQPAQLDENTMAVCDNLKAEGVTVFAVAFEAPASGASLMNYCASSTGHYFNTNGAGLSEAFQAIGRQINAQSLRLTL
jgi:hypothetical protein